MVREPAQDRRGAPHRLAQTQGLQSMVSGKLLAECIWHSQVHLSCHLPNLHPHKLPLH